MRPSPRPVIAWLSDVNATDSTCPTYPCCTSSRAYSRRGIALALQADSSAQVLALGERGHSLGFLERAAERPLAIDRFAGFERLHHQVVVPGDTHADDGQVEIGTVHHLGKIAEGEARAEGLPRGVRGVLVCGAHGGQLVLLVERLQRGNVGVRAPAAAAARTVAPTMPTRILLIAAIAGAIVTRTKAG